MNNRKDRCKRQPAVLPAVLLLLALVVGAASVGHAEDLSSLVITTERPAQTDFSSSVRDEIHERTQTAVWMTRINVGTELNLKLGRPSRKFRLTALNTNERG